MEHDTVWDKLKWYLENEPVRLAEDFRILLFALPVILQVTVDQEILTGIATIFSIALSWFTSKDVRNRVSPVAKIEGQLQYDPEFNEQVDNYG